MNSMYTDILEDVVSSDAIIEQNDTIYRTDDAQVFSGWKNTSTKFNVKTKDPEKWLIPSMSTIRVRFCLTDRAGTQALPGGEITTLIAGGAHLFDQVRLVIDNNQVELVQKPGYAHLIEHLLTSSVDQLESAGESEWLYLDNGKWATGPYVPSATTVDATIGTEATDGTDAEVNEEWGIADLKKMLFAPGVAEVGVGGDNPQYNSGFAMRWLRTRAGRDVELAFPAGRLFSFFADIRSAFRGVQFELEFNKNTRYNEILHGMGTRVVDGADVPASALAAVLIKKIDWIVPTYIPNTLVLEKVQRELMSGERVRKVFHSSTCYDITRTSSGAGDLDVDWRVQSTGKKITRVVVAFQRQAQYAQQNDPAFTPTTKTHSNGGVFSYLEDINNIELRFGNTILPRERYTRMSFSDAEPNYARNYVDFVNTGNRWLSDEGSLVSYDSYKNLYPLFSFDLSQMDLTKANTTSEDLRIVATVNVAGAETIRILAVVQYEYNVDMWGVDGRLAIELP